MPEPLLMCLPDGGEIQIESGEPLMSDGLENAAFLSLFGGNTEDSGRSDDNAKQWWGNLSETIPERRYRSETQNLLRSLPAVPGNLQKLEDAVERDLDWMRSEFEATVAVDVSLPALNTWRIGVSIEANARKYELAFTHMATAT
jgi:hypothetical protein